MWVPGAGANTPLRNTSRHGHPVIVFIHGGMYRFGDRRDARNVGCAWAQHGFVTVVPSYRLLRPCRNRFPDPIVDAAAAVKWTMDNIRQYVCRRVCFPVVRRLEPRGDCC